MSSNSEAVTRFRVRRRAEAVAFLGGVCVLCGSNDSLEFDHIDPKTKSFEISEKLQCKREVFFSELAKCQLLCKDCHVRKSRFDIPHVKLTWDVVDQILLMSDLKTRQKEIAAKFGIHQTTVSDVVLRKRWKDRHR